MADVHKVLTPDNLLLMIAISDANPAVIEWLDEQALPSLYLSAISLAELRSGIAVMPEGRLKTMLHQTLERRPT